MLPNWTLAAVVAALQTMRGLALVNSATLIAELGDLSRFANPRQLMAYLGLVSSEHSSGASVKRGRLAKAGNSAARQLLIEAALVLPFPGPRQPRARLRHEAQPSPIREIAWKAQLRLCARYRKLARGGKPGQCRHCCGCPRTGQPLITRNRSKFILIFICFGVRGYVEPSFGPGRLV